MKTPSKILVARPDRVGDVILSTPVIAAIKEKYPQAHITFLIQPLLEPLMRGLPGVDEILLYERGSMRKLTSQILARKFDYAIALQNNPEVAWAMRLARVPVRIGPLSQWYTYLCYNHGVRQRRSRVEMHEADYNLALLRGIGIDPGSRRGKTRIMLQPDASTRAKTWLADKGLKPGEFALVHPGMRGSAVNWPLESYAALVQEQVAHGRKVLVTTGPDEGAVLEKFRGTGAVLCGGEQALGLDFLAALIKEARVVVVPSTGPLHMAAALEKRIVTFFPTIKVQSAVRWGPYVDPSRGDVKVMTLGQSSDNVSVQTVSAEVDRLW